MINLPHPMKCLDLRFGHSTNFFKINSLAKYWSIWTMVFTNKSSIIRRKRESDEIGFLEEHLQKADYILTLTDHSQIPIQKILNRAKLVYDAKNITEDLTGNA